MLRFQRALLGELLFIFLGVLGVVTTILFAGITIRLVAKGQGTGVDLMLELLPSMLPLALSYSIPFAWLAAVTLVLGRMVADQEVMAIKAAGVHLRVIALPVLAVGALLAISTTALNAYGVPESQRSLKEGVRRYLPVFLASLRDVDRTVTLKNGRFSFTHYEGGAFHNVELDRRHYTGSLDMKVLALKVYIRSKPEAGNQDALDFLFENAYVIRASESGEPVLHESPLSHLTFNGVESVGASVLFNEFFGTRRYTERPTGMSVPKLLYANARGGIWNGSRHDVRRSMHSALAIGLAPFILGLFATAMALLLPPTGRRVRDFMLCFLPPVMLYFPLYLAAYSTGGGGAVPVWVAIWAANLIVGALGLGLLAWAYRR